MPPSLSAPAQPFPAYAYVCEVGNYLGSVTRSAAAQVIRQPNENASSNELASGTTGIKIFSEISDERLTALANDVFVMYDKEESEKPPG